MEDEFFNHIQAWLNKLPILSLNELTNRSAHTAIISVDIINGFCTQGPLASDRVQGIVDPIVKLLTSAYAGGIKQIILTQDTHDADAVEFGSYPPHCVRGTSESESVPEFKALPFYQDLLVIEKNSIHSGLNTALVEWLNDRHQVDTFIIVGDCTDLCVYQMAMYLRLDANARQLFRRVIVPEDCVQTYDMSVSAAVSVGAVPHPGDLMHNLFLYHMHLNGIEIVKSIA